MFILASGSPRRKELLAKLIKDYKIVVPVVDEKSLEGKVSPFDLPVEESKLKAYAIRDQYPNDEILACDTIVLLDGVVLGKPYTEDVAYQMLKNESGKKQTVISGYTYIGNGIEINRTVMSTVVFNELSDEKIWDYIKKHQPLDKAGAYGIQDEAGLIKCIEGSYDNVMGLPVEDLRDNVFNR
ncbi:MAG: Maf family protein [Bacilli bacterium]|nr:Maf family protein [Bacilli bacterium]